MATMLTTEQLLGRDTRHLEFIDGVGLQPECWRAFRNLRRDAAREGFDLQIASGFRSFDRQLKIWNAKVRGERTVHDDQGQPVAMESLSELDQVFAILRYSALPGSSRHHWGSDVDVFDAAAMPVDYQLQLTPEEVAPDGLFGPVHAWLDTHLAESGEQDFFRPYGEDRGGIAVERWHLSFRPLSENCARQLTPALLAEALRKSGLALADTVLANLEEIFDRFITIETSGS
jgi:LAS superfamily LD-carboxypeptidase LdcB